MVGPWAYGGFKGRHVDRWLSSRAGWSVDLLRGGTQYFFFFFFYLLEYLQSILVENFQ